MMSVFRVPMRVRTLDGKRSIEVLALVDTASTLVVLPPSLAHELGLVPHREATFRLGDNERVSFPVAGAVVQVAGRETHTDVAVTLKEGDPILGVTVLELLGLAVDPVFERLVPAEHLLLILGAEASPA